MTKHTITLSLWWAGAWHVIDQATIMSDTVSATRGYAPDGNPRPASITCRIHDDAWRFDPDNEASDLFGLIGPRTPAVLVVDGTADAAGEVSAWSPGQSIDYRPAAAGTGQRGWRWVDLVVSGVTRRIGSWPLRLEAPMRRANLATPSWAYYPCEDEPGASVIADLVPGNKPASVVTGLKLATHAGPLGSELLPEAQTVIPDGPKWGAPLVTPQPGPTVWQVSVAINGVGADFSAGGHRWWRIFTSAGYTVTFYASDASGGYGVGIEEPEGVTEEMFFSSYGTDNPMTTSVLFVARFTIGARTVGRFRWATQGAPGWTTPADYTWTAGWLIGYPVRWEGVTIPKGGAGHYRFVAGPTPDLVDDTLRLAFDAYGGEPAGVRFTRLLNQAGFTDVGFQGDPALTQLMGPQLADSLPELLRECAVTDDAVSTELRGQVAPFYRTRKYLYENEYLSPWVLQYPRDISPPFDKITDDIEFSNVVRVKQRGGSEAFAQQTTGPYGTAEVGEEQADVEVNVSQPATDLPTLARYWLNRRMVPGARYPQVTIDCERNPELAARAAQTEVGALLQIVGFRPTPVLLRVIGVTAVTGTHRRKVTFATQPFPMGRIGRYDGAAYRYDVRGCTLAVACTATATALQLDTAPLESWTTKPASFPYVIACEGEWLRVTGMTAPSGATNRQVATVVRSVNGVTKTHGVGAAVSLAEPTYYAR